MTQQPTLTYYIVGLALGAILTIAILGTHL